jgi:hypothetical protein
VSRLTDDDTGASVDDDALLALARAAAALRLERSGALEALCDCAAAAPAQQQQDAAAQQQRARSLRHQYN